MQEDNHKDVKSWNSSRHIVLALYKFVEIPQDHLKPLQSEIEKTLRSVQAKGTILLATEGINGTICYPETLVGSNHHDSVQDYFQNHCFFMGLRTRISFADTAVFHRLKVKIKKEIVTIGGDSNDDDDDNNNDESTQKRPVIGYMSKCIIDPTKIVGHYGENRNSFLIVDSIVCMESFVLIF
jgi:predicted sulfurtransferase